MPSDCLTCIGYLKGWHSFHPALKQPEASKTMFFEKQGWETDYFLNSVKYLPKTF